MGLRRHRLIALLLVAEVLALSGCTNVPVASLASTPVRAAAPSQPAPAIAQPAEAAPAAEGAIAPVVLPPAISPGLLAPTIAEAPLPAPAELFAEPYSEARYRAAESEAADAETAQAVQAEMTSGGFSLGKVGGAIGAGLLGTGFLGYFVYAGQVGAKDLMTPAKSTYQATPGDFGDPYQEVAFHSHDGLKLSGWYVPAEVPTTKGLVLFHGHSSNKDTLYKKYGHWLRQKYNLFLYDSRYHGASEGKFTTLGYYERHDAQIAIDQLRARGNTSVGLLGESMGGAVAILAGAADKDVKAVWSDCAFDSLQDAIAPRAAARNYPMASGVGLAVVATVSLKAKGRVAKADPIKFVDQLAPRPFYLVHGQKDDDTTPINGEKLYAKAQEPKLIWRTPDADHAESVTKYADEYRERAFAFFDAAL